MGCGAAAALDMCDMAGILIGGDARTKFLQHHDRAESTMLGVKQGLAELGVTTTGVKASLAELVEGVRGPKVVHLSSPEHFAVLVGASQEWVQLVEFGEVNVLPRRVVDSRYSGRALILPQEAVAGPAAQVDQVHEELSVTGVGPAIVRRFEVINVGNGELSVEQAPQSCSTARASVANNLLLPGQKTTVTVQVEISTTKRRTSTVRLLTNDILQPVLLLTTTVAFPANVVLLPDRVWMHTVHGRGCKSLITITGPSDFELTAASCSGGRCTVGTRRSRTVEGSVTWEVTLTLPPDSRIGSFDDELVIRTSHSDWPVITLPVRGEVDSDIECWPRNLFFGFVRTGETKELELEVRRKLGAPFAVKVASCDILGVVARAAFPRGEAWVIPIRMHAVQEGVATGTLLIETDVPGEEAVTVPIYAHVVR